MLRISSGFAAMLGGMINSPMVLMLRCKYAAKIVHLAIELGNKCYVMLVIFVKNYVDSATLNWRHFCWTII